MIILFADGDMIAMDNIVRIIDFIFGVFNEFDYKIVGMLSILCELLFQI